MKRSVTIEAYDNDIPPEVQFLDAAKNHLEQVLVAVEKFADNPETPYGVRQLGVAVEQYDHLFECLDEGPFSHHHMQRFYNSFDIFKAHYNRLRRDKGDVDYRFGRQVEQAIARLEARLEELEQIVRWSYWTIESPED